jgi:hypothetical protein
VQINNAGVIGATAEIDTTAPLQDVVGPLTYPCLYFTFSVYSSAEILTVVTCSCNWKILM